MSFQASPAIRKLLRPTAVAASLWLGLLAALATAPAFAQADVMRVRVDTVRQVRFSQTVSVIGRLVAQQAGVVAARINGPIEAFEVEVGDRVEVGQVIAILDATALEARRDFYAGKLNESKAKLAVKKAEQALAHQNYKRVEKLKKSAAFSQARFDDAKQNLVIARAEASQAETAIAAAAAELNLAEINLYNARVRAPYPGVITERLTEAGAYVQVGAPVIHMIGDRNLEIEAEVPFQHLAGIEPGIEMRLWLDDGTEHSAVVRALLPSENPLTRTRAVRFVPDIGTTLRPLAHDQSVTLEIPIGRERQVLTVHKDAIVKRKGKDIVYVADGNEVVAREVRLGAAVGSRMEVLDGLAEGDKVVVRGNERLRPGAKIKVVGES